MLDNYYIIIDIKRVFTLKEKSYKLMLQDDKCDCCKKKLTLEKCIGGHILCWKDGNPTDAKSNLVVLCFDCNSEQSSMSYEEFKKLKLEVKI